MAGTGDNSDWPCLYIHRQTDNSPCPRSGHRAVATSTDAYIWGGYCPRSENIAVARPADGHHPVLFLEMWRYNIATDVWALCPHHGDPPLVGAASCAMCIDEWEKRIYVYGGTNYPFGEDVSNKVHQCDLVTYEWKELVLSGDTLPSVYGASMALIANKLFVLFGSDGYSFRSSVYRIDLDTLTCKLVSRALREKDPEMRSGRYRQDIGVYKDNIFVFGGGGYDGICFDLKHIPVFNTTRLKWKWKMSLGDPIHEYPRARRHHSIVSANGGAFMAGGIFQSHLDDDEIPVNVHLWRYDFEGNCWNRLGAQLPQKQYFHAAATSESGQMFIHGGIVVSGNGQKRSFRMYSAWLKVPRLYDYLVSSLARQAANPFVLNDKGKRSKRSEQIIRKIRVNVEPSRLEGEGVDLINDSFEPPATKRSMV